jgi:hypothetical protein
MKRSPKVISIESRRPKAAIPVTLVLGMPGGPQRSIITSWMSTRPDLKYAYVEPTILLGGYEECSQCILLEKTLSDLEGIIQNESTSINGVWLAPPVELDTRLLVEKLQQMAGIRIDAISTWVDVPRFMDDFASNREWKDRFDRLNVQSIVMSDEGLKQPVLECWVDQLELCDVLVLMDSNQVPFDELESIRSILKTLHPEVDTVSKFTTHDETNPLKRSHASIDGN